MALATGTKIGPYEIQSPLGAGGMGEVYRARDTRLDRSVAIKVLSGSIASTADVKQRFEREARVVSQLNHPHICTLYDVGQHDGTDYLVMEYLEGETLAQRLAKGALPLNDLLKIAIQIADALEQAHRAGIIHRDLKPGNVMLTKSGAKLLDFGLAKPLNSTAATPVGAAAPAFTAALTLSSPSPLISPLTMQGSIIGTVQYMSPEQLQGLEADRRSDIFAFGAMLYEMATGQRAFLGKSQIKVASAILEDQPAPIRTVRADLPPSLEHIVATCLAKGPDERYQSALDLKLELRWIAESPASAAWAAPAARSARWRMPIGALILAAVAALGIFAGWWVERPGSQPLTRLSVDLGPQAAAGINLTAAISPDGRRLAFLSRAADGNQRLATRSLDQAGATILPGTEGAADPFFSPDSQWIGFFADKQLKKISVLGGAPVTLCSSTSNVGASWSDDGNIVASLANSTLSLLPDSGGTPRTLTTLAPREAIHRWPQVLPGATAVLFTAAPSSIAMENASIEVLSLKTGQVKTLVRGGYYGRYLPSGHLVYVHNGVLFGVKFNPGRLELSGSAVPLLEDVAANAATGGGQFDFSRNGTFVYATGKSAQEWQLSWLDNSGQPHPIMAAAGTYSLPRLSPDGNKVALTLNGDIYVYDFKQETLTRLTFAGDSVAAVWSPDGKHLAADSASAVNWLRSDGAASPQKLLEDSESAPFAHPWSISPDGKTLAYFYRDPENGFDNIWTVPLDLSDPEHPKIGTPKPFVRTTANQLLPSFSPDGRWIAYRSSESGTPEIYVRPFPESGGGKWQISSGGALYAFWSHNGRELFYETADNRVMVADYSVQGPTFVPGKRRLWLDQPIFYAGATNLDLAPDGKRFLVLTLPKTTGGEKNPVHITMLQNFFDELKRRIP